MPTYLDSDAYQVGPWASCPLVEHKFAPHIGVMLDEQWQDFDPEATNGSYVVTQATAGTAAKSTADPGVLLLDSDSSTSTQGVQIQQVKFAVIPAAGTKIFAEWQFKIVDTYDKVEFFIGLSEIDTSILASSANSSANHLGWEILGDDGVLTFVGEKAGTRGTKTAATIAEDTWIRLGLVVDGVTSVQQYINGVAVGTPILTANIPIVALYPSAVVQSAGTNDPIGHLRPYRVYQTFPTS